MMIVRRNTIALVSAAALGDLNPAEERHPGGQGKSTEPFTSDLCFFANL
jgi:hypothetical protein